MCRIITADDMCRIITADEKVPKNHVRVLRHTLMSMVPVGYRSFTAITAHVLASMPDTLGRQNPQQK